MSIITIYRVWVEIPQKIHNKFSNTFEYSNMLGDAIKGNIDNSYDYYDKPSQIADFYCEQKAKDCENKIKYVVNYFSNKLKG
jgi:hypothetical protein